MASQSVVLRVQRCNKNQRPKNFERCPTCNFFVLFFQITVLHFCSSLSSLWKLQLSGAAEQKLQQQHIYYIYISWLWTRHRVEKTRAAPETPSWFSDTTCALALEPQLLNFSCFSAFHQGSSIQCVWKKEFSTFSIFSSGFFLESVGIFYCVFFEEIRKNISDFILQCNNIFNHGYILVQYVFCAN